MGDLLIKWFCSKPSDNPLCKTYQSLANDGAGAYYNRGAALLALIDKGKLLDEAIADYKRAIEINPKNSVSTDELDADMKGSGVEKDELITDNEEARAHYKRGAALLALIGKGKLLDTTIVDYRRAIELNPEYPGSTDELDADIKDSWVEIDGLITDKEIRLYTEKLYHESTQLGFNIWEDPSFRHKTQDATNMLKNILGRQGLKRDSDEYKQKLALGLYYLTEMPANEGLGNEVELTAIEALRKRGKLERIEKALQENGLTEFWDYLKIAGGLGSSLSVEE